MTRPPQDPRRRNGVPVLLLCLLLAVPLGACSEQQDAPRADRGAGAPTGPATTTGSVSLASARPATQARFRRVHGWLPVSRRKAVRREVAAAVERWWGAAYLGGSYPRTDFEDAFPGFTRGARAQARRDVRLMSNRDIGARVDSVALERGAVVLDVLAVGRRARAVTARFVLRFSTTGRGDRSTVVRGRLFLTRRDGPWRIFGYDVTKAGRA